MPTDPLTVYLHDHLAGSKFAIELLTTIRDQHRGEEISQFTSSLLEEICKDRARLQDIVDRVGTAGLDLKEAAAWMMEKVSQLKLRHKDPHGFATFQALETISLGILGKLALWQALPVIARVDARVPQEDYEALSARAREQFVKVEQYRLKIVDPAFLIKDD